MFWNHMSKFYRGFAPLMVILLPRIVFASSMPWESGLMQIQNALTGTTAHIIIVVAIALAGLSFAIGDHGSIFRKAAGIIFGGSIATGAASLYLALRLDEN